MKSILHMYDLNHKPYGMCKTTFAKIKVVIMVTTCVHIVNYIVSILCFLCIYGVHSFLIGGAASTIIIAAFGAAAVLSFSITTVKHSFLKIILASIIAGLIGVYINQIEASFFCKLILTISSCILILNLLDISYPPAGAITMIPLLSNEEIQSLGYVYVLYPITTGLIIIYSFSILKEKLIWQVKKQLK